MVGTESLLGLRSSGLTERPPDPQVKETPGACHPGNPAAEQDMVGVAQKPGSEVGLDQKQVPPRPCSGSARGGSPSAEESEIKKKAA